MRTVSAYAACAAVTLLDQDRPGLVIAVHGLTGTRAQPLALLAGVDVPEFGVLAPDLRAHGDTPLSGPAEAFTAGRLAQDLTELVRHLGLTSRRVCVLGISLGATVALELMRSRSLDIVAGIFVRPTHSSERPAHLSVNESIASYLRQDPATALDRLLASDAYREVEAVSPSAAWGLRDKVTKPRSAERAMRLEAGSRWTAFLGEERVDTPAQSLVIGMPRDPLHPLVVAEDWQARIARSSLVIVPSRDDDPAGSSKVVRAAIGSFLHEVGARTVRRA